MYQNVVKNVSSVLVEDHFFLYSSQTKLALCIFEIYILHFNILASQFLNNAQTMHFLGKIYIYIPGIFKSDVYARYTYIQG